MKYLLDTHTLIWHFEADPRLPARLAESIDALENGIFISMASLWEMTIKQSLGKLMQNKSLELIFQHLKLIDFSILAVELPHLLQLRGLPFHHRDPFDRLLIATALAEDLILMSADQHFADYNGLKLLWE